MVDSKVTLVLFACIWNHGRGQTVEYSTSGAEFNEMVGDIPLTVTNLTVSDGNLVTISVGEFTRYSNLKYLQLPENGINILLDEAFAGLILERLDLRDNLLMSFSNLDNLRVVRLILDGNQIMSAGTGWSCPVFGSRGSE